MVHFGGLMVPVYGIVVAFALMCGAVLAVRCAQRLGLDTQAVWNLVLIGILAALVGSRLEYLLLHLRAALHSPAVLLNGDGISLGGWLSAVAAVVVYLQMLRLRGRPLPLLRMLDALSAPLLLVLALMELAAGYLLWDLMRGPAIVGAVHLLACAAIVVWLERKAKLPLRAGELFGTVLYLLAITMFAEVESFYYSSSHPFIIQEQTIAGVGDSLWFEALLVLIATALWIDWSAFRRGSRHHAV